MNKIKPFVVTKAQVWSAYKKVRQNGKATGVDNQNWGSIR